MEMHFTRGIRGDFWNLDSRDILVDDKFTAIVSAFATYSVVDVPCAAVGADSESRDKGFVVSTTFRGSGVRLSAFRMCHFYFRF